MLTSKEYISQLARGIEPALAFKEGMRFPDSAEKSGKKVRMKE